MKIHYTEQNRGKKQMGSRSAVAGGGYVSFFFYPFTLEAILQ
jgi:hypothetical protein